MDNSNRVEGIAKPTAKKAAAARADGKLPLSEKICYGLGDCAANIYAVGIGGTFLTGYYTDTAGIAAAAIATMMLVLRVFDGITDLIMGGVVDKTKSRFGKARPWLLWTAPLMMIGMILLFMVPQNASASGKLLYAYVTYFFMSCIVYTANNLPYNALLARMTLNVQERATTASVRFIMNSVVTIIINAVTPLLVVKIGFTPLAVVYGIIEMVLLLICFFGCKEHVDVDETGKANVKNVPLKKALPAVLKNKYFYLQAALFLVLYLGTVAGGTLSYYYFKSVMGNLALLSIMSFAGVPALVMNFFVPNMVAKVGKRKLMIYGSAVVAIGSIIIGLANTSVPLLLIGSIVKGIGTAPILSGIFAMTADIVDYGEWKTGIRSEGLINSCTSFGMKVGIGLGSAVGTGLLAWGGYNGQAEVQSASALAAIKFGYGYLGTIVAVACIVILLFMNIDKNLDRIQADLSARHAA